MEMQDLRRYVEEQFSASGVELSHERSAKVVSRLTSAIASEVAAEVAAEAASISREE